MVSKWGNNFSTYLQHVINQDLINSINFAITNMQTQSVLQYLSWLSQRWGQTAYNSVVGNLQYSNQISLSNWHLYGSSRLGIKQTDTTLYSREITINGFDTLGNVLVNEVLDSVQLQIDTANYSHTLATKQYELTNHLGNVLATVLDRKTLNQADVVSANNYYPYHSNMQTWSVPNKTAYNFGGANGQEKDNEIRPDLYGALYWEFDSRLGGNGRWNVDPKPHPGISPYATYAGNPVMFVDVLGDTVKTNKEGAANTAMAMDGILDGRINPISYDEKKGILMYDNKIDISSYSPFQQEVLGEYQELINSESVTNLFIVDGQKDKIKTSSGYITLQDINADGLTSNVRYNIDENNMYKLISQDVYVSRNPMAMINGVLTEEKPEYAGITNIHEMAGHAYLKLTQPTLKKNDHNILVEELHGRIFKNFKINGAIWYKRSKVPTHERYDE